MNQPSPNPTPPEKPAVNGQAVTVGLGFIGAGTALAGSLPAFQLVGVLLILVGLASLAVAAWPLAQRLTVTWPRRRLGAAALFAALLAVAALGLRDRLAARLLPDNPHSLMAAPSAPDVQCLVAASTCDMTATSQPPGQPLLWNVPATLARSADGALAADAQLGGEVAGRYVALACRSTPPGEYVLVVRPDNRSFELLRWDGDDQTPIASGRPPNVINPSTEANHLELRCIGPSIRAAVNGVVVATSTDDHYRAGQWYVAAGILAENTQAGAVSAHLTHVRWTPATPTG